VAILFTPYGLLQPEWRKRNTPGGKGHAYDKLIMT